MWFWLLLVSIALLIRWITHRSGNAVLEVPIVGSKWSLFARYEFYKNAWSLIGEGYAEYRDQMFKVSGHDIVIVPNKHVEEMRRMPEDRLSSIQANIDNFEGLYSTTSILLEGHLHTTTIQSKLTPKLALLVPNTQLELQYGLDREIPNPKEHTQFHQIKAFELVLKLVSHIAARHFVGFPLCRNDEWIATALQYTENAFRTIILLRIFPDFLKPCVAFVNPYAYKVNAALRKAKAMVIPLILERRKAEADSTENGRPYDKPQDFLQWMMDGANEHDGRPDRLAHRLLILTLAAVHTTSMAATQTLFDMCVRPEYLPTLTEEVSKAIEMSDGHLTKKTLNQLHKLDSFMRESQRLSPPSLLGFKRAAKRPITLSDGTHLPKNAHLMMAVYPIVVDPDNTEDPYIFRGMRHFEQRLKPGEFTKHQFATTSATNLHFGHGKYACPGRFFASNTIKLLVANLLLDYEFRLLGGSEERPSNVCLHEYVFPNPEAILEIRKKPHHEA